MPARPTRSRKRDDDVGGRGTALIALAVLSEAAAALAFAAGAVNGYVLNHRWTFAAADSARARTAYVRVQATGALASGVLVWVSVHEVDAGHVGAYVAAVPPITLATFLAHRFWTFRR